MTSTASDDGGRVGSAHGIVAAASAVVGFHLAALVAFALSRTYGDVAALWPATALAAVTIRRNPGVSLPWTFVGLWIAAFAAVAGFGTRFDLAAVLALTDVFEVAVALFGLHWLDERRLDRSTTVFLGALAIVGVLAPLFGASAGAGAVSWFLDTDFWTVWKTWWTGNLFGAALVMPIAASLTRRRLAALWCDRALAEATLV